mmetsp:Transcript_27251/g.59542  ORF Transcript_27251/g.59542 Transcript_27251/m.59542 type:complete len:281 (+) Transcript_27251:909-1751(+)
MLLAAAGSKVQSRLAAEAHAAQGTEVAVAAPAANVVVPVLLDVDLAATGAQRRPCVCMMLQHEARPKRCSLHLLSPWTKLKLPVPPVDFGLLKEAALARTKVVVANIHLAAAPAEVGAAVVAVHLVAALRLLNAHVAGGAVLGGLLQQLQALHLVQQVQLYAPPLLLGHALPLLASCLHLQLSCAADARLPRVPSHVTFSTEDVEAGGALPHVILVLEADGFAARAVHHVLHAVQGALQQQGLPPRILLLTDDDAHHIRSHRRSAAGLRAPDVVHLPIFN